MRAAMEYTNETLGVKFSLPDRPNVRQQLAFRGNILATDADDLFLRYFMGAMALISNWECGIMPDPRAVNWDAATDPRLTDIVVWVSNTVGGHMSALDDVPKNS
jgi:hypothetical protein